MNAYYVPGSVLDAGDTKIKAMVPTLKILLPYGEDSQVTNYENIGERDGMLTKFPKGRLTFAVSTPSYSIHFLTLQSGPHPFLILISQCHQGYPTFQSDGQFNLYHNHFPTAVVSFFYPLIF